MPRTTKAQLERQVEDLQDENIALEEQMGVLQEGYEMLAGQMETLKQQNEELKKRVRRGCDRSRSPQRPVSSSQANLNATCKAFAQVNLWQRDSVVQEQTEEIQRLQGEVARLRTGNGPIGEVLRHNRMLNCVVPPSQYILDMFALQKTPVNAVIASLGRLADAQRDIVYHGGVGSYAAGALSPVERTYATLS